MGTTVRAVLSCMRAWGRVCPCDEMGTGPALWHPWGVIIPGVTAICTTLPVPATCAPTHETIPLPALSPPPAFLPSFSLSCLVSQPPVCPRCGDGGSPSCRPPALWRKRVPCYWLLAHTHGCPSLSIFCYFSRLSNSRFSQHSCPPPPARPTDIM